MSAQRGSGTGLLAALLLCLAVGLWHGATVRPGHTWWGMEDFTAYLIHGRNLFADRPYDALATVTDPELPPSLQRKAFPPVFSLLVAVVDRCSAPEVAYGRDDPGQAADGSGPVTAVHRGLPDLVLIKRVLAGFFAAGLFVFYLFIRQRSSPPVVAATLVLLGTSPYLFSFRELVRSEVVFLLLLFGWCLVVDKVSRDAREGRRRFGLAAVAGVLLALAYGTRTAAIAMAPAVVLLDVVTARRVRLTTVVLLAVAGMGLFAQRAIMPAVEGGYLAKAANEFELATIKENVQQLRWNLERFFTNGFHGGLALAVTLLTILLAAVGFLVRARRPSILEMFVVTYVGMILVLPTDSAWFRYLIPVLPMYLLYVFTGAEWLGGRGWTAKVLRHQRVALAVPAVLLGLTWIGAHGQLSYGPLPDGLGAPATDEVFSWVSEHTGPDDVIVFSKARSLTLSTGRAAISYPRVFEYGELPDQEIWRHLEAIDARLLVLKHSPPQPTNIYRMLSHSDREFLPFVERNGQRFTEVFRNGDFVVLEVLPGV